MGFVKFLSFVSTFSITISILLSIFSVKINCFDFKAEKQLINKWSPVVYFHPNEKYFPCSVDWILENSINYKNQIDIYNDFKQGKEDIHIQYNKSAYVGQKYFDKIPCYAYLSYKKNKIYIRYIFVHAYNGDYNILGLLNAGSHEGDIEHIVIELDKSTEKLTRVFLSAHTSVEGKWIEKDKLTFEENKIVVYSALNGHGLYEKEGVALRYFGIANDYLEKGRRWEPIPERIYSIYEDDFNPKTMGFFSFSRDEGNEGNKIILGGYDGIKINDFTKIISSNKNQNFPTIYNKETITFMKMFLGYVLFQFLFMFYFLLKIFYVFKQTELKIK